MHEESILKKIFITIKKYILIIFLIIGNIIRSLFGAPKKEIPKFENQTKKAKEEIPKQKETKISNSDTGLPDEDNIKTNPHDNKIIDDEIKLQKPQRLYKVYTKDNVFDGIKNLAEAARKLANMFENQ